MGRQWFNEEWLQPYRYHRDLGSRARDDIEVDRHYEDLCQTLSQHSALAVDTATNPEVTSMLRMCLDIDPASRASVHELSILLSLPGAAMPTSRSNDSDMSSMTASMAASMAMPKAPRAGGGGGGSRQAFGGSRQAFGMPMLPTSNNTDRSAVGALNQPPMANWPRPVSIGVVRNQAGSVRGQAPGGSPPGGSPPGMSIMSPITHTLRGPSPPSSPQSAVTRFRSESTGRRLRQQRIVPRTGSEASEDQDGNGDGTAAGWDLDHMPP